MPPSIPQKTVLCIDAGNSCLKSVVHCGDARQSAASLSYADGHGVESLERLLHKALPVGCCVVACSPARLQMLNEALARALPPETSVQFLNADSPLPFSMNYTEGRPGADRIANVFRLRALSPRAPAVVADFGTTTHLESVDAAGGFAGGLIMPGLAASAHMLSSSTAGTLPTIEFDPRQAALSDGELFAFSTKGAIENGLLLQQAAAVDRMFDAARTRFGPVNFFITGGASTFVMKYLRNAVRWEPHFTTDGLHEFAKFHFAL
ncbi:type III pantothenate kinase [Candidatus Sumerlaeota bacterium]|nr:type III pantothenate kinase [Candidatus Sumerlaeota bacterium]